jgi:hypothetical protein
VEYYFYGLLPKLPLFAIICAILLVIIVACTMYQLKQPLPGQFIIRQKDSDLSSLWQAVTYWVVFILALEFLASHHWYFLDGFSFYFFIILAAVVCYQLFYRWYVRQHKPGKLSIDKDTLCIRSLFKTGRRKLEAIQSVKYNIKQNAITLHFPDGLDNIRLYLAEFERTDLQQLFEVIKTVTNNTVQFDDNFNQFFAGKQNTTA